MLPNITAKIATSIIYYFKILKMINFIVFVALTIPFKIRLQKKVKKIKWYEFYKYNNLRNLCLKKNQQKV
jgi:hypothetical protein